MAELLNALGQPNEVGIVPREEHIVAVRDNHAMVAEDQPREYAVRQCQLLERLAGDGGAAADARLKQAHLALRKVLHVECSGGHENARDFVCRDELRVEHEINIKIFFEILSCLYRHIHVADACDCVRDAVLLREYAGNNVHLVALRHGDEDIRALDVRVVHRERTCDVRLDRQYIERCLCRFELAILAVHHDNIHAFLRKECRDAVAQPSSPCNYDPHNESLPRLPNEI